MRELMWRGPTSAEATHLLDSRLIYEMFSSKDKAEGVEAFLGKRPVQFTGTMEKDAPAAYPWWEGVDISRRVKASVGDNKAKL